MGAQSSCLDLQAVLVQKERAGLKWENFNLMGFLVSRKDFLIERTYTPQGALVNTQQGGCEAREFAFVTALRQSGGFWSSLYALISKTEDKSYRSYCSDCLAYFFSPARTDPSVY